MALKKVIWGIIGCGDVTEVKSGPAFSKIEGSELIAVMRRDAAKAADYAMRHNVSKFYSDADKLIADNDINAIYVATPPDTHAFYTIKALEAGKPVYVEKPMARTYSECKAMIDASEKTTDWSGPNAWTTISGGQAAECNAVLLKPTMPNPIPPDAFWDSLKHMAVKGAASYIVKAAVSEAVGPVVGFAAGKGVDYIFGMGERAALAKKESDQYNAWTQVYDAIKLQTACKIQ